MAETAEDRQNDTRSDDAAFARHFPRLSRLPQLRPRPVLYADRAREQRSRSASDLQLPRMQPLDHGIRRPTSQLE